MIFIAEGVMVDLDKVAQDYQSYAVRFKDGELFVLIDDPENLGYLTWVDIVEAERVQMTRQ